ncbi:MAG: hypothetical protein AB8F94_24505 [Saprospiraceae bacterium]
MKNPTSTILILLTISFFFLSCSNYYYSPNDGDLVTLRKQHDTHISGSSNLAGNENKKLVNIQAGYSPINHLAFAGSYFKTSDRSNDGQRFGNGSILNGSIGGYYFIFVEESLFFSKSNNRNSRYPNLNMESGILLDLYVGMGKGEVNNLYREGGSSQFKFQKNYVQMGFHYIKPNWGVSYNVRRGWLNYSDGKVYNQIKIDQSDLKKFQDLTINNSFNLIEHSFRLHAGISHVRYFFNVSSVIESAELKDLGVGNDNFNVGFIIEIDEFFRKIKKEKEESKVDF